MLKSIIGLAMLLPSGFIFAQNGETALPPEPASEIVVRDGPFHMVEEPASFKGGQEELNKYLIKNLKYPKSAIEAELEGRCYIKFVVTKKGKIIDVAIAKKVPGCPECDAEAVRVVKKMPKWVPAKVKGQKVNSHYNLPITFKLT